MNRIIIIGEGQTEQEFCNDVLQPFFNHLDIYIQSPTIKKSKGGIVLKKEIILHLKNPEAKVTTLIDYYGIHKSHGFPEWDRSKEIVDKSERMDFLEGAMKNDIPDNLRYRFIPYIQLHEFEALLFSDISVIKDNFEDSEFIDYNYLIKTFNDYPNPEDINDSNITAPSKRLDNILERYNKTTYGALLAEEIGLETIRAKCPRFNNWIDILSQD